MARRHVPAARDSSEWRVSVARGKRSAAVSAEENKAVIRRWIEAFNARDLETEADALAPGFVAHIPDAPARVDLEGLEA